MSQLLGLDLGTSSVKALLVSDSGETLGESSAEYPTAYPRPGWAEQNPEDWWRGAVAAVRQALAGLRDKSVAAIGLSGQMHGTLLLGGEHQLLSPAIIWRDQRSERQVQEITALVGAERLIEIAGSPVATGFQAATLRWLQQEQPDVWRQVRRVLLPKDYLRWRLTGTFATDPSDGSGTLLLDVRRRDWSPALLAALGIDAAILPPVQPAVTAAGPLTPEAADALSLPAGTPVVTGAADTACSALGAGVTDPQTLLLTISTGGQMMLPASAVQVDRGGRIHTFCGALEPSPAWAGWYELAAILSAGACLRWLRERVFGLEDKDAYDQMTAWGAQAPPGANGLLFLPYLAGERTPHMDPQARGLLLGLTASHGREELVRAAMEGVALAFYDAYHVLSELGAAPQRIVMAGGGACSRLWQQIVADVFGLPVQGLKVREQSALGAALLAGGGIGLFNPATTARKLAVYDAPVEPAPGHQACYQTLLGLFRSAYQKHRDDFRRLQEL